MPAMPPLISIVIPLYNRELEIVRALASCTRQEFADFEIIVVDDASTDRSADVVNALADPRITLVRHARNRGPCPARNTGVAHATGEWILLLDSDDELLPGALARIAGHARHAPPEIARLAFMYAYAGGGYSPEPPLEDGEWDYHGYLRWAGQVKTRVDFNNCIRRETFRVVPLPDTRAFESGYHLDFAARYRTRTCPEAVAIVHLTAAARASAPDTRRLLADAGDWAVTVDRIMRIHGGALRSEAPELLRAFLKIGALQHLLAGHRRAGLRYLRQYLRRCPTSPDGWVIFAAGMLHPHLLARAKFAKRRSRI